VVRAGDGTVREVFVDAGDASVLGSDREDDALDVDDARGPGSVQIDEQTQRELLAAEQAALAGLATVDEAASGAAAIQPLGGGEAIRAE
jgi:hypothetical protein